MSDSAVWVEEVDLLNARDAVHSQPLERALKPLVVRGGRLVDCLFLSAQAPVSF